ncbi:MAG: hypothetical protein GF353_25345 [Candidatus Lokiarchaeota archaeon]|nr:hypothetical protein [Candidatus Lokiarchaeota archaeon]
MREIKQLFILIGIDNLIIGLTGLVAVTIAILEFTGLINLSTEQLLKMILIALGLLMTAVVSQALHRSSEVRELKKEIGIVDLKLLNCENEFQKNLTSSVSNATRHVLDTALNFEYTQEANDPQDNYKLMLQKRIEKNELVFRRIELIYNKERLEDVIQKLFKYGIKYKYYIKYYQAPPKAFPLINLMSFDDDHFYLGGFYSAESPSTELVLFIKHPDVSKFFKQYWDALWLSAKPLNERNRINKNELKRIALDDIGITENEFESIYDNYRNEFLNTL